MSFDFDAAVSAPFRMQPGLRRLAAGSAQLTPLAPGSRHQREKLAVLSAFWRDALLQAPGVDASAALAAVCAQAAQEHPAFWHWDGKRAAAPTLGVAVKAGAVEHLAAGRFGLGDELQRCLNGLPPSWRLAGLLALAFAEDLALVDARSGTIPWLAVCLPSAWAPRDKIGQSFADIHAPVADNQRVLAAAASLMRLVTGPERWERFVWTLTDHPRLHAHPDHLPERRWADTPAAAAWFRSERQTFIPLPGAEQAVFTIAIDVQPLARVVDSPARAQRLHDALATMSDAVLAYRGLAPVRDDLLRWLAERGTR